MTYDTARRLVSLLDVTDDQTADPDRYTIVDDTQAVIEALIADQADPPTEGEDLFFTRLYLWQFLDRHNIDWR